MSDESRRKLLKSIAAGSGAVIAGKNLPESWSRPVVDSIMLPVHAQTSMQQIFAGAAVQRAAVDGDDQNMMAQAMDYLLPKAEAGGGGGGRFGWYICAMVTGGTVDLTIAGLNWCSGTIASMIRRGNVPMDGTLTVIQAIDVNNCWSPTTGQKMATVGINPANSNASNLAVVMYPKFANSFELNVGSSPSGCPPTPPVYDCILCP
ncbi:MAG: hypothetical protein BMS9Abin25_1623 [Gammaproteobacteria bacterium]|nr:MAG: hypothetical protein BMS9Abin25_1623 [Gammaproteobacteria bacterium]